MERMGDTSLKSEVEAFCNRMVDWRNWYEKHDQLGEAQACHEAWEAAYALWRLL